MLVDGDTDITNMY